MDLLLVRHLWGVDLSSGFRPHLEKWRVIGYGALEGSSRMVPDRPLLLRTLRDENLSWIPQVYTEGGSVARHLASLREQVELCLDETPLFINAHSGSDTWSLDEALDFYGAALDLEGETGIAISHETHRRRFFGNPWSTNAVLQQFPDLKATCDFSHWVCVAERLLEDCGTIIQLASNQCHHVHARVGFEQGPQVSDPRAPEWALHVTAHEKWWDLIWAAQRNRARLVSTLTPEFGPAPYLPAIPFTQTPVADLGEICDWMAQKQATRFRDPLK